MIEEEFRLLLDKSWTEDEKAMIKRIMENLLYYKKLLPKSLKTDIVAALQLCNKLKHELEAISFSSQNNAVNGSVSELENTDN